MIYGKTAKDNYDRGVRSMKGESFLDSEKYFRYILDNYPVSRYRTWAELGIADSAFGRDAYLEAKSIPTRPSSPRIPSIPRRAMATARTRSASRTTSRSPATGSWCPVVRKRSGPVSMRARAVRLPSTTTATAPMPKTRGGCLPRRCSA